MKPNIKRILAALAIILVLAIAFFIQSGPVFNSEPTASISVTARAETPSPADASEATAYENIVTPSLPADSSEGSVQHPSQKPAGEGAPACSAQPPGTACPEEKTPACTLTISCKTILDNMDKLTKEKESFIPADGWLLSVTDAGFTDGETVFDVLQRELKARDMHLEFTTSPMYNTVYIEGICNIYEFDCGELSGWMYSVNGVFPSCGCSEYKLSDGDIVAFVYTCDLGRDVGKG